MPGPVLPILMAVFPAALESIADEARAGLVAEIAAPLLKASQQGPGLNESSRALTQLLLENLRHGGRVGLAAGRLHRLAHEELDD